MSLGANIFRPLIAVSGLFCGPMRCERQTHENARTDDGKTTGIHEGAAVPRVRADSRGVHKPLLGAGTANLSELPDAPSVSILELQAFVFACLCGSLVLVLRIIEELWQTRRGGLFNVDDVLQEISLGLEEELDLRIRGLTTPQ